MTAGETPSSSHTSSAVAPSFLHRCPHSGALGPPRRAEPTEIIRERQRATLTLARGRRRSLAGSCSGVVSSGRRSGGVGGRHAVIAKAEISYQTCDCRGAAWLLDPVPAPRLRHHIPQAFQTGSRLAGSSLLDGTALPHVKPSICLHSSTGEEGGPSAHGVELTQPSLGVLGPHIIDTLLLFQCFQENDHHGNTPRCSSLLGCSRRLRAAILYEGRGQKVHLGETDVWLVTSHLSIPGQQRLVRS